MLRRALFLDRDGVIHVDTGYAYRPEQIQFIEGIFDFCRVAHERGYVLVIITNQSGIGRGLYSEEDFHHLMAWMDTRFEHEQCPLTSYYFCPHHPEHGRGKYRKSCACRKPEPGMILQAVTDWSIDLQQSLLLGDQPHDIAAGEAAGVAQNMLFSGSYPVAAL